MLNSKKYFKGKAIFFIFALAMSSIFYYGNQFEMPKSANRNIATVGGGETTTSNSSDSATFVSDEEIVDQESNCYNPLNESRIIEIYGANFMEQIKPLLQEAYEVNNVDPRLIFHRMVGESLGNPDARNPSSGAYGIFQVLGGFYRQSPHKVRIEAMYPSPSTKESRQYTQVLYHVQHYVREGIAAIGYGSQCNSFGLANSQGQEIWNRMSPIEQSTFLGWGSCSSSMLNAERAILNGTVHSYDTSIMRSFIEGQPLCESFKGSLEPANLNS